MPRRPSESALKAEEWLKEEDWLLVETAEDWLLIQPRDKLWKQQRTGS